MRDFLVHWQLFESVYLFVIFDEVNYEKDFINRIIYSRMVRRDGRIKISL